MGELTADWDSKRCEVFGNVEDMSEDERKKRRHVRRFLCRWLNYTEVRDARLISATKSNLCCTLLTCSLIY